MRHGHARSSPIGYCSFAIRRSPHSHRIHYDRSYVTEVEGYPGLVVHGPLIATLLIDLLRRNLPRGPSRDFLFARCVPLFDVAPFFVCGKPDAQNKSVRLWAKDAGGFVTMDATGCWRRARYDLALTRQTTRKTDNHNEAMAIADQHQDIRDAVRDSVRNFRQNIPRVDEARGYRRNSSTRSQGGAGSQRSFPQEYGGPDCRSRGRG